MFTCSAYNIISSKDLFLSNIDLVFSMSVGLIPIWRTSLVNQFLLRLHSSSPNWCNNSAWKRNKQPTTIIIYTLWNSNNSPSILSCIIGVFFKCHQSTKYKTGSTLVFLLLQNLNISNCLEKNWFSTLSDFFENCRRKISKKMEFCSAFKISRSVKLIEGKRNQKMAFVCSSRNHQNCSFQPKKRP